jgi:hypothetical protein
MAQLINPTLAQAATIPLAAYAAQEVRGMKPLTAVIAAQFKQGQYMEQQIQLLAGKCYAALAVGAGIGEMNIKLVALQPIPGIQNPVLAEDRTTGASAALGARGQCYKWSFPIGVNAKVVYTAASGQGIAAARVYVK